MAAKITRMTAELYVKLVEAWHKNSVRMCDADRGLETLEYRLFNDGRTVWYQGPGQSWMYISEIAYGGNANLHVLNLDGQAAVQVDKVRPILQEMFREHALQRMSIWIPSPLVRIAHAAQQIGFTPEGRLRDAAIYSGRLVDVEIFGLVRSEIEEDKKPSKKRKRTRRGRRRTKAKLSTAHGQAQKVDKNGKD